VEGDVHHWDVWHGFAPWQELAQQNPPFMSEFGLQALPDPATLGAGLPPSLEDPQWGERKLQAGKLAHYLGPAQPLRWPEAVEASQRAQAAALQWGIETCRLRREGSGHSAPCGGVAFWQFNEPWSAVSWSVVDRAGRPKRAYQMLKSSYAPLLVAARFERKEHRPSDLFEAEVWLVNDSPKAQPVGAITATVDTGYLEAKPDRSARPVRFEIADACLVESGSALCVGRISVRLDAVPCAIRLECEAGREVIARNSYDLSVYLPPAQPARSRMMRRLVDRLLKSD
jgi:hypothetical protein